jgi:hypothetical protein
MIGAKIGKLLPYLQISGKYSLAVTNKQIKRKIPIVHKSSQLSQRMSMTEHLLNFSDEL